MNWKKYVVACGLLLTVGCLGEPGQPISVSEEQFGDDWPLTVPRGKLDCFFTNNFHVESVEVVYFIAPDVKEYLLKGSPMRTEKILLPIDSIQKLDAHNPRTKKNLDVLIEAGFQVCPF